MTNKTPTDRDGGTPLFQRWLPYFISVCALSVVGSLAVLAVAMARPEVPPSHRIDLLQLQVYAKGAIHAERSDYQGPTAAGGTISLADFRIDGDLSSGQDVIFHDGQLTGYVNAPKAVLSRVFSSGQRAVDRADFEIASLKLDLLGARMSALRTTTSFVVARPGASGPEFRATAADGLTVVEVASDRLVSREGARIVLAGGPQASILVRIHGRSVHLDRVAFAVEGGIDPSRIVFFFPEAQELEISSSGGARDSEGHLLDIPGSVVAPDAVLHFASSTIDGQVFAQSIEAIEGFPSGQVNRMPATNESAGVSNHFVASSILLAVESSGFSDRADSNVSAPVSSASPSGCTLVCRRD